MATAKDPIADKFSHVRENNWESFDGVINTLFGENTRVNGRLVNVAYRGPQGMLFIADYLEKAAKGGWIEWAAALPKYQRIHDELAYLGYVDQMIPSCSTYNCWIAAKSPAENGQDQTSRSPQTTKKAGGVNQTRSVQMQPTSRPSAPHPMTSMNQSSTPMEQRSSKATQSSLIGW